MEFENCPLCESKPTVEVSDSGRASAQCCYLPCDLCVPWLPLATWNRIARAFRAAKELRAALCDGLDHEDLIEATKEFE